MNTQLNKELRTQVSDTVPSLPALGRRCPSPLPQAERGPSLESIYRVSYADTASQLFLRTVSRPSKQMHLWIIGNYK